MEVIHLPVDALEKFQGFVKHHPNMTSPMVPQAIPCPFLSASTSRGESKSFWVRNWVSSYKSRSSTTSKLWTFLLHRQYSSLQERLITQAALPLTNSTTILSGLSFSLLALVNLSNYSPAFEQFAYVAIQKKQVFALEFSNTASSHLLSSFLSLSTLSTR